MHRCIVQYTLTLLSRVLAPACVSWIAPQRLRRGLVDAGNWGDARQLAQIEVKVAPVRVELFWGDARQLAQVEVKGGTSMGGVVAQLASSMVRFLLLSIVWQSWLSLVHPRPVGWSTGEAGRCTGKAQ